MIRGRGVFVVVDDDLNPTSENDQIWNRFSSFNVFFLSLFLALSVYCLLPSQFTFVSMGIRRSKATLWNRYENCILKCLSVGFCFVLVVVAVAIIIILLVMMAMVYRNIWITRWSAVPNMEITLAVIILETRFRCHRNNFFFHFFSNGIANPGKWDCNLLFFSSIFFRQIQ